MLFNLCVVCYPWSRTVQFEPFVRKLSQFFSNLEKQSSLLSSGIEDDGKEMGDEIQSMLVQVCVQCPQVMRFINLEQVYTDMNTAGRCEVVHGHHRHNNING